MKYVVFEQRQCLREYMNSTVLKHTDTRGTSNIASSNNNNKYKVRSALFIINSEHTTLKTHTDIYQCIGFINIFSRIMKTMS